MLTGIKLAFIQVLSTKTAAIIYNRTLRLQIFTSKTNLLRLRKLSILTRGNFSLVLLLLKGLQLIKVVSWSFQKVKIMNMDPKNWSSIPKWKKP